MAARWRAAIPGLPAAVGPSRTARRTHSGPRQGGGGASRERGRGEAYRSEIKRREIKVDSDS